MARRHSDRGTDRRIDFDGLLAAHQLFLVHHQGHVHALQREEGQAGRGRTRFDPFPYLHVRRRHHRARDCHSAAGCHLEDQHVRLWRTRDSVLLGVRHGAVLEEGAHLGCPCLHGWRRARLLPDDGRRLQAL